MEEMMAYLDWSTAEENGLKRGLDGTWKPNGLSETPRALAVFWHRLTKILKINIGYMLGRMVQASA